MRIKAIAVLKFNQQDNGDRIMMMVTNNRPLPLNNKDKKRSPYSNRINSSTLKSTSRRIARRAQYRTKNRERGCKESQEGGFIES